MQGLASFSGPKEVAVGGAKYTADHVMIAVGGRPTMPDIPGIEHCVDSDGFFLMDKQPKKVAVVGAGYIAVELAGIFNALEVGRIEGGGSCRLFLETLPKCFGP